jgi:hypothetical protein
MSSRYSSAPARSIFFRGTWTWLAQPCRPWAQGWPARRHPAGSPAGVLLGDYTPQVVTILTGI